jgi:hypothetical protein
MSKHERFTNGTGSPVADNINILTAGRRSPELFQDIWPIQKLAHFDREVIPERRMVAVGISVMALSPWPNLWIYLVADFAGAAVAAGAFKAVNPLEREDVHPSESAADVEQLTGTRGRST